MAGRPREFDRIEALERAMQLFWKQGYEATSLTDITEHLGIGRQSLYLAFGDKESLFHQCLDHYTDLLAGSLLQTLEAQGPVLANLEAYLSAAEQQANGSHFHGCLLGSSLAELGARHAKLSRTLRQKVDRIVDIYERAFQRALENGELRRGVEPKALARAFLALTQGAALMCRVLRDPDAIRQTLDGARCLLAAHAAPRAST